MVREAKLTTGKSKTLLLEQRIIGLNRQLSKLNSKVELISAWIFKTFGVSFHDEACAALMQISVDKLAGQDSSLNPDLKENAGSDLDSGEQYSGGSDDGLIVESDVDDDRTPLKVGEPKILAPPRRQRKRKAQRNKLDCPEVRVNGTRRSAEARIVLADQESKAQTNTSKHYCEWQDCNYSTNQKSMLLEHHRTHNGEKPFSCTWSNCGKSFALNGNLHKHRRIHTGEKPYHCEWPNCGKLFNHKTNARRHRITHTKERLFKCSYCDRRFGWRNALAYHVRTHTGEKPYTCGTCGAVFAASSNKVKHEKRHGQTH